MLPFPTRRSSDLRLLPSSADSGTWAADETRARNNLAGTNETVPWPQALPHPRQRFSRVSGTRHKVSVFKVRERREPFGLSLRPSRWLWRSGLAFSRANGEANRDVVVRNVCDRDRRDPRRGGDRRLGSAGNDGSRRDGAVAVSASRTSSAPPRGLSSPAGAGRASRSSSPAPPRGRSSRAG